MSEAHDWRAEASGLAWMIGNIATLYRQAKSGLGGDSELLASAIHNAERYVDGPMLERWQSEHFDGSGCSKCGAPEKHLFVNECHNWLATHPAPIDGSGS
jgi:hypothetical protein